MSPWLVLAASLAAALGAALFLVLGRGDASAGVRVLAREMSRDA